MNNCFFIPTTAPAHRHSRTNSQQPKKLEPKQQLQSDTHLKKNNLAPCHKALMNAKLSTPKKNIASVSSRLKEETISSSMKKLSKTVKFTTGSFDENSHKKHGSSKGALQSASSFSSFALTANKRQQSMTQSTVDNPFASRHSIN